MEPNQETGRIPSDHEMKAVLSTLKQVIRKQKKTYKQIAEKLEVSEQTIKRIFSSGDISLSRLGDICQFLGVSVFTLFAKANESKEEYFELSEDKEEILADDPSLHAFFYHLRKDATPEQIKQKFSLDDRSVHIYLRRLEELGLIDYSKSIKIKVVGSHNWIPFGPLHRKYYKQFVNGFFDFLAQKENFNKDTCQLTSTSGLASMKTVKRFITDLDKLIDEIRRQMSYEKYVEKREDMIEVSWITGVAANYQGVGHPRQVLPVD